MALLKDYSLGTTTLNVTGAYHQVVGITASLLPTPTLSLQVAVYASQAARTSGTATPVAMVSLNAPAAAVAAWFGSAVWKNLVKMAYANVLKVDPTWQGAVDVLDPAE